MSYLHDHPNFKYILKNRALVPRYVIKGEKGYLLVNSVDLFTTHIGSAEEYAGANDGKMMFAEAKQLNAKVYLQTLAGEIEIRPEDFPNA